VLALGVTACATRAIQDVAEGESVHLGELQFNVIFSRYLNPNDTEDSAYLVGQKPAPNDSNYFGVFLLVQNESNESQRCRRPSTSPTPTTRNTKLIRAKASTPSPSAKKSKNRNRSRSSTRPRSRADRGSLALLP